MNQQIKRFLAYLPPQAEVIGTLSPMPLLENSSINSGELFGIGEDFTDEEA